MTVGKIIQLTENRSHSFSYEEIVALLEIAKFSLADQEICDQVAMELDLSDEYICSLNKKLQKFLDNPAAI